MKTVFLQPGIGRLDESKPAPWLLLERDSNRVVAHQAEILEEVG